MKKTKLTLSLALAMCLVFSLVLWRENSWAKSKSSTYQMTSDVLCGTGGKSQSSTFAFKVSAGAQPSPIGKQTSTNFNAFAGWVYTCQPSVVRFYASPLQNELNVPVSTNISVTFNLNMNSTTINDSTFVVNALSTGLHKGAITYDSQTKTATLDPSEDFEEGEIVTVVLTSDIQSSQGIPLGMSYVWSFTIVVDDGLGCFAPHSVYPVGANPYSAFVADVDGDGDLDLATANYGSDSVSVLLNNGDGTFVPDSVYAVGDRPASVFAADLNGDGDLDLATANSLSDNVSVLLNNGDSTFAPHSDYPVGDDPEWVFAGDLDGDGDLDLAIANRGSNNVSILLNNGDGTFAPHSVYPVGDGPGSIFAADLDRDGDLDLTTANNLSDDVSVLLNNGDGTFAPHSVYPAGDSLASVFAADLDDDGDLDLAVANWSDRVSVLLNNGDGTFAPHSVYPVGDYPNSVFAGDLDGDGDLDLATANYYAHSVSVLLNNGDGTFAPHSDYPAGDFPASVFAADLDGDGDLDLATANGVSHTVSVLLNQSTFIRGDLNYDGVIDLGDVLYLISYLYKGGPPPCPIELGDVNCDEVVDLGDVLYLISYLYKGGPAPCEGKVTTSMRSGSELYKGKAPAQIGFSSPAISKDGIFEVPVMCKSDVDVAGVQLEIKYDPEKIVLMEPALTPRAEGLQIYSSAKDGVGKIGILDLSGEGYISAGTGAVVTLRGKGSGLTSLEITEAILLDRDVHKIPVEIVSEMKKSEEDFTAEKSAVPQELSLSQNYPNPFNPETEISYALPTDCHVKLTIYNITGQKVKTLIDEHQTAGYKNIHWNGRNEQGKEIASGVYFYKIQAGDFSQSRKMLLLK